MTAQEIGATRREFRPALENTIAGVIIGLLMIGGGCAAVYFLVNAVIQSRGSLPFWAEKGWSWGALAIIAAVAFGLVLGGVWLIRWMRSLFSLRVGLGVNGLSVTQKGKTQVIAWSDIVSVEETHLYERVVSSGLARYASPKVMSQNFLIKMRDSEAFGFDVNIIRGHLLLAQMVKKETDKRNIPWEIVERDG